MFTEYEKRTQVGFQQKITYLTTELREIYIKKKIFKSMRQDKAHFLAYRGKSSKMTAEELET